MKIKLNKEVITLAEVEQAKKFAEENSWIDKETVVMGAIYNVKAYHEAENIYDLKLIGTPELTVEKNHYQMVIWCNCLVKYYFEGCWFMAEISMDLTAAITEDKAESFIILYGEKGSKVIQ